MIFKFVAGNKIEHAINCSKKLLAENRIPIINYISEKQKKNNQYIFKEYEKLIKQIDHRYYIALKCSSFNSQTRLLQKVYCIFTRNIVAMRSGKSRIIGLPSQLKEVLTSIGILVIFLKLLIS